MSRGPRRRYHTLSSELPRTRRARRERRVFSSCNGKLLSRKASSASSKASWRLIAALCRVRRPLRALIVCQAIPQGGPWLFPNIGVVANQDDETTLRPRRSFNTELRCGRNTPAPVGTENTSVPPKSRRDPANEPPQWIGSMASLPLGPVRDEASDYSAPQPPGVAS